MSTDTFYKEVKSNIKSLIKDTKIKNLTQAWFEQSLGNKYSYNFSSFGVPIIQYPQDMIAMQEIIWAVKPDLIIETGVAHGGSLIQSASILALIELDEANRQGKALNPSEPSRQVVGIDIEIRDYTHRNIREHFLAPYVRLIEGSSISDNVIKQVEVIASKFQRVMVVLDSNHTHEHVLEELFAYAPLVSTGSYCVVYDTVIEDLPAEQYPDRDWGPGNSPKTAVNDYLQALKDRALQGANGSDLHFVVDEDLEAKLQITVAPSGYLKRV